METIILIAVLLLILGSAIRFVSNAKKKGQTCIGCPHSGHCSGHCKQD